MRNIFLLLTLFIGAVACKDASDTPADEAAKKDSLATTPREVTGSECFAFYSAKDTISLQIDKSGTTVTGNLNYKISEKDSNKGTITGVFKGDTLFADYSFMSEGVNSVRPVAFLKTTDGMVEGYGETIDTQGKLTFKNTGALNFGGNMLLQKVNCTQVKF